MKLLKRNQRKIFYANYLGRKYILNKYGNKTGEWEIEYGPKIEVIATVTPATGYSQSEQFGVFDNYDKVVIVDNPQLPIDSVTVFWIDNIDADKHDYKTVRIASQLNSISVAVSKIEVNEQVTRVVPENDETDSEDDDGDDSGDDDND